MKVTFYKVKDNSSKIQLIVNKAQEAYLHEKRLLIVVPNSDAAQYVDSLLWRIPQDSFLPHIISDTPTEEWIAITTQDKHNINQACLLLNLCSTPTTLYQKVEEIFDLIDETHQNKIELSLQRLSFYQAKGLTIKTIGE